MSVGRTLLYGVGLGFRYYTAFGPLRLDLATPLHKRSADSPIQVYIAGSHRSASLAVFGWANAACSARLTFVAPAPNFVLEAAPLPPIARKLRTVARYYLLARERQL